MDIVPLHEKPEFAETCAAWSFSEWGCYVPGLTLESSIQSYKDRAQNKNKLPFVLLALENDKIMTGMISLKLDEHLDRPDLNPWVGSLIVHRRFQGRHVAEQLFEELKKVARNKFGFEKMYLFTCRSGKGYELAGWKHIGMVKDPMGFHSQGEKLYEYIL